MVQLKGTRVGLYARFSDDKQNASSSTDQLAKMRRWVDSSCASADQVTLHEFNDDAITGTTGKRSDYERALRMVRSGELDVLIAENTARLSRDLENSAALWKACDHYGVQLLTVDDGIDSSRKGTKLQLGMKALMDDAYIDTLIMQTQRGMVGAHDRGNSTGLLPFGYRSEVIPTADPRRTAGCRVLKDPAEAALVVRMFEMYAGGESQDGIARRLNAEGVPSPRAGSAYKRQSGWVGSTIRELLRNEKYIGVWRFNERRWVKDPHRTSAKTGKPIRVARKKDPSEVTVQLHPDRRLVDEALWDSVQTRLKTVAALYTENADGTKKGRAAAGQASRYPLSSLLLCGALKADGSRCGAPMSIQGAGYYRCGDYPRGACINGLSVKEELVRGRLLDALRERLGSSEALDFLRKKYALWAADRERTRDGEANTIRDRLARTEKSIANIVVAIGNGEYSEALSNALRDKEHQVKADKRALAALAEASSAPIRLPSRDEVLARVVDLGERVKSDPIRAREALRQLLVDGRIYLEPQPGRSYIARATYFPLGLVLKKESPPQEYPEGAKITSVAGTGFEPMTFGL